MTGREHLVSPLNELDGHLLAGALVQRKLNKAKCAAVQVLDLQASTHGAQHCDNALQHASNNDDSNGAAGSCRGV